MSGLSFNPRAARLLERRDPQKFAQVMRILDLERADSERELYEGSLLEFFRRAWQEIDPKPISIAWFHEAICDVLEQVTFGEVRDVIVNIPPRHSKALACDTPVLTTWGWKLHGELCVGDFVFGPDGNPKRILAIGPRIAEEAFAVSFDDGATINAGAGHLWEIERDYPYRGPQSSRIREKVVVTTTEMIAAAHLKRDKSPEGKRRRNAQRPDRLPVCSPLVLPPKRLLIDPYVLGVWLGDGATAGATIYVGDEDIEHFCKIGRVAASLPPHGTNRQTFHHIRSEGLQKKLRVLGLLGNKHIPDDYLEASTEQRWELLRGLMDTDGCATVEGCCTYITKLPTLGSQAKQLACSLGLKAYLNEEWSLLNGRRFGPYYKITFTPPEGIRVFNLERKQSRMRGNLNPRSRGRYLESLTPLGEIEVNCISVEGNLYLAGKEFVVTHNSTLINIVWPAWIWCRGEHLPLSGPHVKFLTVAYSADLAEIIGLKMLRLVSGEWYQGLWGDRVQILKDQTSRANFANSAGGERLSNSIQSGLIGRGGDIQVVDDPHSLEGAESDAQREETLRAISEGLPTRITDPRISARVMVMQRLHDLDATSWALDHWRKDLVHLMFPARFDPSRACALDQRTEPGELLWPEVWTEESLDQAQKELDEYAKSGQFQQMPIPRGGGIIKRDWWRPWPELDPITGEAPEGSIIKGRIQYPAFEYIVAWVDTAFTEKVQNDPCAMTVWGLFRAEGKGRIERRPDGTYERVADDWGYPKVMLIYGWSKHLILHGPPEEIPYGISPKEWNGPLFREQRSANWGLVEWVVDTARRYKIDHLGIESQAAGLQLETELRNLHSHGDWGIEVLPAKGSKDSRVGAFAISHLFSAGQVYAPTFADGSHPSWCEPIIDQISLFPRGRHDDFVDTMVASLTHLRSIGMFERKEEFDLGEEDIQKWSRQKMAALPYDL